VSDGALRTSHLIGSGEAAIFAEGGGTIDRVANGGARFVIGSARKHPHELVLGDCSVHTSLDALQQGEAEILRIGKELRAKGTLRR
jgi:hypothetical protein